MTSLIDKIVYFLSESPAGQIFVCEGVVLDSTFADLATTTAEPDVLYKQGEAYATIAYGHGMSEIATLPTESIFSDHLEIIGEVRFLDDYQVTHADNDDIKEYDLRPLQFVWVANAQNMEPGDPVDYEERVIPARFRGYQVWTRDYVNQNPQVDLPCGRRVCMVDLEPGVTEYVEEPARWLLNPAVVFLSRDAACQYIDHQAKAASQSHRLERPVGVRLPYNPDEPSL